MSELTLKQGYVFASLATDWHRERSFHVAFALSVLVHGLMIAIVPGFRPVAKELPVVLNVELAQPEPPPTLAKPQRRPEDVRPEVPPDFAPIEPAPIERSVMEPLRPQPRVEPLPEPTVQVPEQVVPPVPRAEIQPPPRPDPRPEPVVTVQPVPRVAPPADIRPEPQIEQRKEPPPLARVLPRPEPRVTPVVEPLQEPRIQHFEAHPEPRPDIRPEPVSPPPAIQPQAVARQAPRPVSSIEPRQDLSPPPRAEIRSPTATSPEIVAAAPPTPPRVEVAVAAPVDRTAPPPSVTARAAPIAPPVAAVPAPPLPKVEAQKIVPNEEALKTAYSQSISKEIRRSLNYPPIAERKGWQGTTEVLLQMTADGKVADISVGKSSGHKVLDDEALRMVRKATLPRTPEGLRGRDLTVRVPIVFKLES